MRLAHVEAASAVAFLVVDRGAAARRGARCLGGRRGGKGASALRAVLVRRLGPRDGPRACDRRTQRGFMEDQPDVRASLVGWELVTKSRVIGSSNSVQLQTFLSTL